MKVVSECMQSLVKLQADAASSARTKKPLLSVEEQALAAIEAGLFFDVFRLDPKNIQHMAFTLPNQSESSVELGGLSLTASRVKELCYKTCKDLSLWRSCFIAWIAILIRSSAAVLLSDRLDWFSKLINYPSARDEDKVNYGRTFMMRFAHEPEWLPLFRGDTDFLWEFLISPGIEAAQAAAQQKLKGNGGGTDLSKNKKRKDSTPTPSPDKNTNKNQRKQQNQNQNSNATTTVTRYCKSRLFTSVGDCLFSPCRFAHKCPCCGVDHPASKCTSWVDSVAKAKNPHGVKP
jgi:hypothetical protein